MLLYVFPTRYLSDYVIHTFINNLFWCLFHFFQKPGIPLPRPEAGSFLFFVYFLLISSQLLAKLFPLNLFAPRPSFRCSSLPNPSLIHVPDKSFFREFYFLDVMQDFMDMLIQASEFYHLFDLELVGIQKVSWSTHFPLTLFFLFRFVLPRVNKSIFPCLNPVGCFL